MSHVSIGAEEGCDVTCLRLSYMYILQYRFFVRQDAGDCHHVQFGVTYTHSRHMHTSAPGETSDTAGCAALPGDFCSKLCNTARFLQSSKDFCQAVQHCQETFLDELFVQLLWSNVSSRTFLVELFGGNFSGCTFLGELFLENFSGGTFWTNFSGGTFLEELFWRTFLGELFWMNFSGATMEEPWENLGRTLGALSLRLSLTFFFGMLCNIAVATKSSSLKFLSHMLCHNGVATKSSSLQFRSCMLCNTAVALFRAAHVSH